MPFPRHGAVRAATPCRNRGAHRAGGRLSEPISGWIRRRDPPAFLASLSPSAGTSAAFAVALAHAVGNGQVRVRVASRDTRAPPPHHHAA